MNIKIKEYYTGFEYSIIAKDNWIFKNEAILKLKVYGNEKIVEKILKQVNKILEDVKGEIK